MIVYEFFSGVGGMHQALNQISSNSNEFAIKKIYAFDINPNANATYTHNFGIKPYAISIEGLLLEDYERTCINDEANQNIIWTMSPPCQPFTRQGNEKDLDDMRTTGFKHLIDLLSQTKFIPNFLFLENVKNFEYSDACEILMKALINRGYTINQFLLSPNQFGIPNSRLRYYLLARGPNNTKFPIIKSNDDESEIITTSEIFCKYDFIQPYISPPPVKAFIEFNPEEENNKKAFYLEKKVLMKEIACSVDVVTLESTNTNCFTKGYTRLLKGSGSILLVDESLYSVIIYSIIL
jgi:tRNA (cytosine38-C5)-methyltransferase